MSRGLEELRRLEIASRVCAICKQPKTVKVKKHDKYNEIFYDGGARWFRYPPADSFENYYSARICYNCNMRWWRSKIKFRQNLRWLKELGHEMEDPDFIYRVYYFHPLEYFEEYNRNIKWHKIHNKKIIEYRKTHQKEWNKHIQEMKEQDLKKKFDFNNK